MTPTQITDMALSQLINANTQNACLAEALRELATYIDNGQRTVDRYKAEAAQAETDLANATTAIESLQATIAQLTGQLTQLQSAKIAAEDKDPIEPAEPDLLAELLKTHYQLGPDEQMEIGDLWTDSGKHPIEVKSLAGSPASQVKAAYRPIPTNIPLPEGVTIPDGYCALAKGEVVPEGSKLWASRDGEKVDWVKSNFEWLDQNTSFYYIRPQEGVTNG